MLSSLSSILDGADRPTRIAVLGVTPEVVQLDWPNTIEIDAYDHSQQMIDTVWKPHPLVASSVTLAQWQNLPVADSHFHAIVGDGSFNVLPTLEDHSLLSLELHRATQPGALLAFRCFVRPEIPESLQAIRSDAYDARIGSFHALKWRIAMALASESHGVVPVQTIYQAFESSFDRPKLANQTGWSRTEIATIDAYQNTPTSYTFPTLIELRKYLAERWHLNSVATADYELAQCCPTLRFERKS